MLNLINLIGGKDFGGTKVLLQIIILQFKSMASIGTQEFRNFIDLDEKLV